MRSQDPQAEARRDAFMDTTRILLIGGEPSLLNSLRPSLQALNPYILRMEPDARQAVIVTRTFKPHLILLASALAYHPRELFDSLSLQAGHGVPVALLEPPQSAGEDVPSGLARLPNPPPPESLAALMEGRP